QEELKESTGDITQTPEFKKWFGKSEVVDKNGKPLVVYHGAEKKFDSFDVIGKEHAWDAEYPEGAIFFADRESRAKIYGHIIMPVYLKGRLKEIHAPRGMSPEQYIDNNEEVFKSYYDGGADVIKVTGMIPKTGEKISVYIAFNPNQIKSVDNKGTFNSDSDNIYEDTKDTTNTKAYVFDFDDTLATTKARIKVTEDGQVMHRLTPQEFNTYKLRDEESFDFSDFDNPKFVLGAKKYKMWKPFANIDNAITKGNDTSKLYILTARGSNVKDAMMKFFKKNGIKNLDPENIYTVKDMENGSTAAKKKLVLRGISNKHKGKVTFYDDNEDNINAAKSEVDDARLVESILDEPKENLDSTVWQSGENPEIKPSVKKTIMKRLKRLMGKYPVYKVYIVGSITGKRWNELSDIDVTVIGDMTDDQQQEIVKQLKYHNEIDLEGTQHPVNFYVANKDLAFHRFDSVYDLLHDAWLKESKDYGVDLSGYYDQFKSTMSGIDKDKSEAIRSLVDIELLEKAIKNGGNAKVITRKIMNRIGNLDDSISKLSKTFGDIFKDRVAAFLRYEAMTPEEKINIPSPNLLPENVRYKVLERYNYLSLLHKIYDFTKDSGKIDTPQEVREIKDILGIKDAINESIECMLESIDKGRDNFEKSLKNWNDKAYGKKKSGKQPEEQNKEIDKMNEEPTFEYTGGKRRKVNKSRDGIRQDSGKGNKGTKRKVSFREQMKRELGGMKANIKTKARGKQAQGDAKKIIGQILNPNSKPNNSKQKVISESWYKAFKNRENKTVDVFMNPSKKDLKRESGGYNNIRGFIHGNNLFVWNGHKSIHDEVANNIQTNQKEAIPVMLYINKDGSINGIRVTDFSKRGNWFRNPNTKDAILKNKYIRMNIDKQSMKDEDFIDYFDSAIVGKWEDIN
ncbi:hypothetical protein DRO61_08180, partial [Candidatus Bathyarchaeota archaeon]